MNTARLQTLRILSVAWLSLGLVSLIGSTLAMWRLEATNETGTLADAAVANPGLYNLTALLVVVSPVLLLAGIPAVVDLARGRGWVLTTLGGYLTGFGLAAGIGHAALYWGLFGDMALAGSSAATNRQLIQGDDHNPLTLVLLIVFLVGFSLGPIALTLGLRRARLIQVWVPVAAVIATVANFAEGTPAGIVQLVAFTSMFVAIIFAVWQGSAHVLTRRVSAEALATVN